MDQHTDPKADEKHLLALGRILQTLREEENVDVLIETTLNYLESEFEYKLIWIALYDHLDHRLLGKGGRTPQGSSPLLKQRFLLTPGDLLEQVVIEQRPVGVPDLREETRAGEWRKAAQQFGIQGTLFFPIGYKIRCFGVALLGSELWGVSPSSEQKALLSIVFGALASALFQIEADWLRQQTKHPQEPLLTLVSKLTQELTGKRQEIQGKRQEESAVPEVGAFPTSLDSSLKPVIEETHKFIQPDRTNIYWYYPERRYFWRRLSNQQKPGSLSSSQAASGIIVSDVGSFYQALAADQIVFIGEARSSLAAGSTGRLMQLIRARSLLAAPILFQGQLLGFLAVEDTDARIWKEEEKNYVRGAAQLVSLVAPLAEQEATIEQIKLDQALTSGLTQAIYTDEDWHKTLQWVSDRLLERLKSERFLVFRYDAEQRLFEIAYQNERPNRRSVPAPLPRLSEVDLKLLAQSQEVVGIENWSEDLKLKAWRDTFGELGVRSLLACSIKRGGGASTSLSGLEGLLAIGNEATRTWSHSEIEIIAAVSQQIGLILHHWQLLKFDKQHQELCETLQWAATTLQQTQNLLQMEQLAMEKIAEVFDCPLAALIEWGAGYGGGSVVTNKTEHTLSLGSTALPSHALIPAPTDPLIQAAIATDRILSYNSLDNLPPDTRRWVAAMRGVPARASLKAIALRTVPEHQPTGMVLIADTPNRSWPERSLNVLATVVSFLAWSRRSLMLTTKLENSREEQERLNWYKNQRLDEIYQVVGLGLKRLTELSGQMAGSSGRAEGLSPLQRLHYQQILRQLNNSIQSLAPLLKQEKWQLSIASDLISLASLLRRSLDRIKPIIQQRQLWTQVHSEGQFNIIGDPIKLELVLNELLIAACRRSPTGDRIDISVKLNNKLGIEKGEPKQLPLPNSPTFVELAIAGNGAISGELVADFRRGRSGDLLCPSTLDRPPGLNLTICKSLLQQMGGELNVYALEDGRVMTELILVLANG